MRPIDAEAFKELIDDVCREGISRVDNELGNGDPVRAMYVVYVAGILHSVKNELKKKIDEAPTAAEQNWVPCKERLPEKDGWYITTFESDSGSRCVAPTKYARGRWVAMEKVVAWMPFSEPWKGEEK